MTNEITTPEEFKDSLGRVIARKAVKGFEPPYVSLPVFSKLALERYPELRIKDFMTSQFDLVFPEFAFGMFELRMYELPTKKGERKQFRTVICIVEELNPEF